MAVGVGLWFGTCGLGILLSQLPDVPEFIGILGWFALALGAALFIAVCAIRPYPAPPRGERWKQIGGPDH
jgi:hypothetical protein